MNQLRYNGREYNQVRSVKITYDVFTAAAPSLLFELGKTKVLCTASIQPGVPSFLRGKGSGWLTAEYALLPHATHVRTIRESSNQKSNGRSVEISRLIGRVLRTVTNLDVFGEKTIYIDCDVLQADGGTRTACITAASLLLSYAQERWLKGRIITGQLVKERVAAVSVGVMKEQLLLDPDYSEDSQIDADFNVIITSSDCLIEMQGGAEKAALSWQQFNALCLLAAKGVKDFFAMSENSSNFGAELTIKQDKVPFFSLKNRNSSVLL